MRKTAILLAGLMILNLLAGCNTAPQEAESSVPAVTPPAVEKPVESAPPPAATQWTGVLYADFSCGTTGMEDERIKEYPFEYTGDLKNAEELAAELSTLTGLDFFITAKEAEDGWVVDWTADSTLIADLDDREQKEEFFFHDISTLRWFMLDSLWRTLCDNLETENIYYTMDGGKELTMEELLGPVYVFPADVPYMGSAFYFAHYDVVGEEGGGPFAATKGLWRLDGSLETASIEMDGEGGFTTYYASGSIESIGYLDYVDEYGDGTFRYDMYTMEGELICSFTFDSEEQFHIGNNDGAIYILDPQLPEIPGAVG